MGSQVERLAAGLGNRAHHRLGRRRHLPSFFLAEIAKAKPGARVQDRMFGDERFEAALHWFGQRIVSRALVGEFGMPADRRDGAQRLEADPGKGADPGKSTPRILQRPLQWRGSRSARSAATDRYRRSRRQKSA